MLYDLEWLFELSGPRRQMSGMILRSGQRLAPMATLTYRQSLMALSPARNADLTKDPPGSSIPASEG
jgi:hypothetical protein